MTNQTPATFPAEISCLFIGGLEEILGRDETESLVRAFNQNPQVIVNENLIQRPLTLMEINLILAELVSRYGLLGSQGLILRVGRVVFKDFYRTHSQDLGFRDLNYRMLPKPERIKIGLEKIAHEFEKLYSGEVIVAEDQEVYSWKFKCPNWPVESDAGRTALIYFFLGIFQEFLAWVTGGKYFHPVREVEDSDVDRSSCVIQVDKHFIS
jgi:hypothetical protein